MTTMHPDGDHALANASATGDPGDVAGLRAALDAIGEAFVIYGPDGRLVLCNENFRRIYGYTRQEARPGVHFQDLGRIDVERGNVVIGDEHGDGEAYLARKAEYRRRLEGSFIVQLKDGRWLKTTDRRTPDGGFVSVQSDVTDLKRAQDEMAQAKREAERNSRAKSDFLAKMSHELRTPLNSILGFSELLAGGDLHEGGPGSADGSGGADDPEKVRAYARSIHHSGGMLLQLINDILDLSKIEAGKLELEDASIDLADELAACVEMLAGRAESAGIALDFEPAADARALRADPRALRQIVLNLLTNAVKFTPAGGRVALEAGVSDGAQRIAVSDTGVGIAEHEIPRILKPFEQVGDSYSRPQEGTGLGLSIANALAEAHGGGLEIESVRGEGTTVRVTFPPARTLPRP